MNIKIIYNGVFSDPAVFNKKVHALFLGIDSEEVTIKQKFSDYLNKACIHNTYYVLPGIAHEWPTWRRCLYRFASLLFKN